MHRKRVIVMEDQGRNELPDGLKGVEGSEGKRVEKGTTVYKLDDWFLLSQPPQDPRHSTPSSDTHTLKICDGVAARVRSRMDIVRFTFRGAVSIFPQPPKR